MPLKKIPRASLRRNEKLCFCGVCVCVPSFWALSCCIIYSTGSCCSRILRFGPCGRLIKHSNCDFRGSPGDGGKKRRGGGLCCLPACDSMLVSSWNRPAVIEEHTQTRARIYVMDEGKFQVGCAFLMYVYYMKGWALCVAPISKVSARTQNNTHRE